MGAIYICVVLLTVASVVALIWSRNRKSKAKSETPAPSKEMYLPAVTEQKPEEPDEPLTIVIGRDAAHPIVTLQASLYPEKYEHAVPLDIQDSSISRLSALCQAVPSMLVAGQATGKRLMEVVVNGDLARAADGNGMRGFVLGAGGVKEHARLFEVANLQKVIDVAAVWQIASVIVAQKHLADISQKLDEIKSVVTRLSQYIEDDRKAKVEGTYQYLKEAYIAIQGGEFSPSVRIELESCDRELRQLQNLLRYQFEARVNKLVEHKERVGTETLTADISNKMRELDTLFQDIVACVSTRILAWHVLALYPGDPKLKEARRTGIEEELSRIEGLNPFFEQALAKEIRNIDSFWNSKSTLEERRRTLSRELDDQHTRQAVATEGSTIKLRNSAQSLIAHDKPNTIFLEFDVTGVLLSAREVREIETGPVVEPIAEQEHDLRHLSII